MLRFRPFGPTAGDVAFSPRASPVGEATGTMIIKRYADDLVIGFERRADAHRFLDMMLQRFAGSRCRFTLGRPA